ncbi:MAG: hypothetical protein QXX95_04415 [Nitrososphaerales archaeon]
MGKIKIAIIGLGNCASSLIQGLKYYSNHSDGLWHFKVGGYKVEDIELVAAFDVDPKKVGKDVIEAIGYNNAPKKVELDRLNIEVKPGLIKDPLPLALRELKELKVNYESKIMDELKSNKVDLVLNCICSGMDETSKIYAGLSLDANCSFINITPSRIAKDPLLAMNYENGKLCLVGDDLISQLGGTAFHKGLMKLLNSRGLKVVKSYQLDVGGGPETLNTMDEELKMRKREIKTKSIKKELDYDINLTTGTTEYVEFMGNNRTSYFWIEAKGYLGSSVKIDIYLKTNDSENAGNILLDVIRATKYAKDREIYGAVNEICSYGFKDPPFPKGIEEAYQVFSSKFLTCEIDK